MASGDTEQPIQWSSEFNDSELGMIYYNYRHYNPVDGRWIGRDIAWTVNLYDFLENMPMFKMDFLGKSIIETPESLRSEPDRWGNRRPSSLQPSIAAGVSNERINELFNMVARLNSIKCEKFHRSKFRIDVYQNAINLEAVKSLPWEGYDLAILISHTDYVSPSEFIIGNHGEEISSHELESLASGRLVIFGCHLSGIAHGKLSHGTTIYKVVNYLNKINMLVNCSCDSPLNIQIVSGDF